MPKGAGVRHCGKCGQTGHYSKTCALDSKTVAKAGESGSGSGHTPLPWSVDALQPWSIKGAVREDGDSFYVAEAHHTTNQVKMEANAALIVLAVNSHAALEQRVKDMQGLLTTAYQFGIEQAQSIERLKGALKEIVDWFDNTSSTWDPMSLKGRMKNARVALGGGK